MVEHNEEFGSGAPTPEGESGPGDLDFGEANLGKMADELSSPVGGESPVVRDLPQAPFKHPHPAPPETSDSPHRLLFPMLLGAAMILVLIVAWNLNSKPVASSTAVTPPDAAAT